MAISFANFSRLSRFTDGHQYGYDLPHLQFYPTLVIFTPLRQILPHPAHCIKSY